MKKNIFLLLACLFVTTVNADCGPNFYAKIFGGVNFLNNTSITENKARYDAGFIMAGSIGYILPSGLCLEGEYAYRRNDINRIRFLGFDSSHKGHFETSSIMANLLWDVSSLGCDFWDLNPMIGVGIGYDDQKMRASSSQILFHQKWRHFSWQIMAELRYNVFCSTDLTLEYKFHQGGSHFNNHSLGIGLIYKFDL